MSPLNPSSELDLFGLCKQLHKAGWDAFTSDLAGEVAARRDHAPGRGVWRLVIDRSGRWRFTATREVEMADGRELVRGGFTMRLLKEKQQVLTVAGNLDREDSLPGVLAELTQLTLEETGQAGRDAEGEATWIEDPDLRAQMSDL
jgi:hypothetical protein